MDEKERKKQVKEIKAQLALTKAKMRSYKNSLLLRGSFIERIVGIERQIDTFLSNYFSKNEFVGNELHEMLWCTERITIGSKKDIMFIILKKHYKDFLNEHPRFMDILERLIPHRNIFAHLEFDINSDEAARKHSLVFKKYKNGKLELKEYTGEVLAQLNGELSEIDNTIRELLKPIKPSQA